jgi:hypothetical protein
MFLHVPGSDPVLNEKPPSEILGFKPLPAVVASEFTVEPELFTADTTVPTPIVALLDGIG